MASPLDNPLLQALRPRTPSGLQPQLPDAVPQAEAARPDLMERVGNFAQSARQALGQAVGFQDVLDSQTIFDRYLKEVPKVRKRFKAETDQLSDEALMAQMLTHDRNFRGQALIPWAPDGGFVELDTSQGHNPALAAAEHRAFVLEATENADTPLEAGALAVALGAATPAYAALKATGLKKGSKPSLAQLVAGVQGSTEALVKAGGDSAALWKRALDQVGTVFE